MTRNNLNWRNVAATVACLAVRMKCILFVHILLIVLLVPSCNSTGSDINGLDEIEIFKIDANNQSQVISCIP